MGPSTADQHKDKLLVDGIATLLGFQRLSEPLSRMLSREIPPSYLLVITALIIQLVILDGYNYFITGKNSFVDDPGRLILSFGAILAVVGIHWMQRTYADAVAELELSQRDNKQAQEVKHTFTSLVPFRVKIYVYVVAVMASLFNLFVLFGFSTVVEIEGLPRAVINNFVLRPVVFIPLVVEFALLYFSIHFLLPRRIDRADLDLFFYDPQNMGGFAPVGQLLKKSYYLYTGGLLVYFGLAYWPLILSDFLSLNHEYPPPEPYLAVYFTAFWLFGVISIAYSMYRMHTVMSRKKDKAIREIEAEIKSLLDDPFDINADHIDNQEKREEIQHRITRIRQTKRYPSSFTMWSQIGISVLLPQALQLALQVVP